ncbi:MAG TPA: HD domain-containing phosphohydrolase [Erysipelothrix sp.]|nr:HD domain-containing phosphohydrolase [Erysipelothrix sp.]
MYLKVIEFRRSNYFLDLVNHGRKILLLDSDGNVFSYSDMFSDRFPLVTKVKTLDELIDVYEFFDVLKTQDNTMLMFDNNRYSIDRVVKDDIEIIEFTNLSSILEKGADSIREVFSDYDKKPMSFLVDVEGNILSSSITFGKYWQLFDVEEINTIADLGLHCKVFIDEVIRGEYINGSDTLSVDGLEIFRVHANKIDKESFVLSLTLIGEGTHFTPGQFGALNEVLDALADGIVAIDNRGIVVYSNQKMLEFIGVDDLIGRNIFDEFTLYNREDFKFHFELPLESKVYEFSWFESPYTNTRLVVELVVNQVIEHDGFVAGYVLNFRDTSLRQSIETKSYRFAYRDSLTGVYNRHFLKSKISDMDEVVEDFAVALFDCNGLKVVNDSFGHSMGDRVILGTANILLNNINKDSYVIRIGGDEFAVIMYNHTKEMKQAFIDKVLEDALTTKVNGLPISLAYGTSYLRSGKFNFSVMLEEAELRMYRDKIDSGQVARDNIMKQILVEISKRHPWEKEHSDLVSFISRQIAMDMDLGDEFVHMIYNAGKYHSIGKIVLSKETILAGEDSKEHRQEYQVHTESAFRILSAMPEYSYLANTVLHYKENYDGTGKPHGLKGTDIPLSSRILRVATSMSKLLNPMDPKIEPHSIEEAMIIMRGNAGHLYDPLVVKSLQNVLIKTNLKEYLD